MPFRVNVFLALCWAGVFVCALIYIRRSKEEDVTYEEMPEPHWNSSIRTPVDDMTGLQMLDYLRWRGNDGSLPGKCQTEKDFGPGHDGRKSVCIDKGVRPEPEDCLVYYFSLNVDINEEFFIQSTAKYGCDVYVFDPLAVGRPDDLRIRFRPYGLTHKSQQHLHPLHNWTTIPLRDLHQQVSGDKIVDLVRLDLSDYHRRTLPQIIRSGMMKQIRQLSIVAHIVPEGTTDELRDTVEILRALEDELGMIRYASNGIPSSSDWLEPLHFDGCLDYEISWYNSNLDRYSQQRNLYNKPLESLSPL